MDIWIWFQLGWRPASQPSSLEVCYLNDFRLNVEAAVSVAMSLDLHSSLRQVAISDQAKVRPSAGWGC